MAQTKIILLERIESLGQMGDTVSVKPGFARNFLLPQKKALRATKENTAYFEAQKKHLVAENDKKRSEAEKLAAKIKGVKAPIIRQASEAGTLFGSVTSRDIADQVAAVTGISVQRNQVAINQNFKSIGLFPVEIILHPEVKVEVIVNIARSIEEAKKQAETGKALIAETGGVKAEVDNDAALEAALEKDALESLKTREAADAAEAEAEGEKSKKKSEARATKKAAKAAEEADAEEITTLGDASAAAPATEEEDE
ncbi:MAG TPA: 50S ribosomal protein L9 [Alphaproteobacteria bacterium]|nr:50S ribosomal protein L9 [Alphaproteobacteria bacterium]